MTNDSVNGAEFIFFPRLDHSFPATPPRICAPVKIPCISWEVCFLQLGMDTDFSHPLLLFWEKKKKDNIVGGNGYWGAAVKWGCLERRTLTKKKRSGWCWGILFTPPETIRGWKKEKGASESSQSLESFPGNCHVIVFLGRCEQINRHREGTNYRSKSNLVGQWHFMRLFTDVWVYWLGFMPIWPKLE